ncbi:PAS domain S-box-containing protein/diguanylate cyclase (GGDEF) domain-containing protein [Anaerovirgula multivorans]|uniref:PAS domain S-box-containing protein/diguanylate cyclase (GGDEF) domain-containing protein n=1 Tax=Anaerovirgula multivorans TaxID=312168 RepID=A0A239JUF3_9FIRM|nr:PAS domain S-box protein [Anaerovirgula multivorans]SNT09415.1 PAS domain S-box-containing protein/diguanylate cyclase (GGDEF) domain-containing protein [Anaerovirgula multivorans]
MSEEYRASVFNKSVALGDNPFELLFRHLPDAIIQFDAEERIVDVNSKFTELFGYTFDEIKGRRIDELFSKNQNISDSVIKSILQGESLFSETVVKDRENGKLIYILFRGIPIVIDNVITGGFGIYLDVTESRRKEEKVKQQQKILFSLFNDSPDAIVYLDRKGNVININNQFTKIFGYTLKECKGKNLDNLIANEKYINEARHISERAIENKIVDLETYRLSKDGKIIPVVVRGGSTIVDNEIIGFYGIYTDITERKKAEEKIRYLSFHDKLTGLYNRAYFEEELERIDKSRQLPISIIIGDVNGLKLINDIFGHHQGDILLQKIAFVLQKACRKEDSIARWGGDEFAILLPNTSEENVKEICQRITYMCSQEKSDPMSISISLGSATKKNANESFFKVIKWAEEKMYRNKFLKSNSTRNSIVASLQKSLFEKNYEGREHADRMKRLAIALGEKIGLSQEEITAVGILAILHDIGKIVISEKILNKPGPLTNDEWKEMKKHSEIGYRITRSSRELEHIAEYVLYHHERWDGKGYPKGLKGESIPKISRIIAIVDAYDVMSYGTNYKEAIGHEKALKEIENCAGTQFDPEIAKVFIDMNK